MPVIRSGNGLATATHQAINLTNTDILSVDTLLQ